ncbi:peptidase A24 [Erythrobacter gaetbuli]|uniref:Peptidase A24 n=1 Tax=Qipengyuania gaetbuli TaxID=266952 RepID=A0A844Y2T6_9SPHN|nr:prepilin peptidase [Qipengyuania gaetbuli]MXO52146.1 peptidase A24 [Qipengyuania gaetbuli]
MAIASLSFGVLAALSTIGALIDVLKRKLPNYLSLAIAIAGLGFAFAAVGWVGLGLHFAHVVVAFLIGYGLFAGGMFGAGDGKFYAGVAAFFPIQLAPALALVILLMGGVMAIFWLLARKFSPKLRARKDDFAKMPYGLAIAIGAVALSTVRLAV